jgi:ABC-type antimicrobial peptide transport system permease subunit
VWLNSEAFDTLVGAGAEPESALDGSVVEAESFGQEVLDAPLRAVIPVSFTLVIAAGFVLALAGFAAQTAASLRERRLESAQLRALGVSQRAMSAITLTDGAVTVAAGIGIGVIVGIGTLGAVGTRLVAAPGSHPVDLVLPQTAIWVIPALGVIAVFTTGLVNRRAQHTMGVADTLRAGSAE